MKKVIKNTLLIALAFASSATMIFAVEPTEAQNALFAERGNALLNQNAEAIVSTYHSESNLQGAGLEQLINARLQSLQLDAARMKITEVIHSGDPALVRVQELIRGTQDGKPFDRSREYIYLLKKEDGKPRVLQEMRSLSGSDYDESTSSFVSRKAGFSLQLPEGWIPTRAPESLASVIVDGVSAISPDTGGSLLVGVVQLPMSLPDGEASKLAAQTDAASMKALATSYQITKEGFTEKEGMPGWMIISEFELYGEKYKRAQMYYENESLIYFTIFDLSKVDQMENELELRLAFKDVLDSFKLVSIDDNLSVAEQVRSDLGQGKISGNIYTNDDFHCYIAAPEGWDIRTSSTPNTLVEMQYRGGRSLIRLMAEDNIPSTITAEKAFRGRLNQVQNIVQNFQETPAQEVSLAGEKAWLSEQKFTLDGLGDVTVKEATFLRDGKYYLVLCQAISPDQFEDLEADFDQALSSFGFSN